MLLPALLTLVQSVEQAGPAVYSGRDGQSKVALPRLEAVVTVDGALDEAPWTSAARLTGFSQYAPVDGRAASHETEVLVWYSPSAIHFGIRAQAVPAEVRATLANRDKIDSDDHVQIFLSPFNDGRQALMFAVNPLGVQADGALVEGTRQGGGGFEGLSTEREVADLSPDFVFDSKGRLTDRGYEVEVRIPFKSLRYPQKETQDWGLHVVRRVQSLGHEDTWTPARRAAASFLAQGGTLVGLSDLRPGLVLDLNPILTAHADGAPRAGGGWDYDSGLPEIGGNVRWGMTSNLTLNGTAHPDFSQVESDAGQFTFDPRSALFFAEKRPFFLEGIEQFATPNRLIYTRRIAAPVVAAKVTGKISGTSVAVLSAVDGEETSRTGHDHPLFNLFRLQRDLGGQSKAAFVYTDKVDGADSNRVAGADARFTFGGIYSMQVQGALSRTHRDRATTTAPLWEAIANRNGRRFGFRHAITGIHPDFNAASGFINRRGIVRANLDHRVTFFGKPGSRLESFSTDVVLDGIWQYRRFVNGQGAQDRKLHINNNAALRGGWKAGASVLIETFGYDDELYADYALLSVGPSGERRILPFTGVPKIPNLDYVLSLNTPDFKTFSGSLFWLWGRDENFFEWASADIVYLTLTGDWRPTERVRVNGTYQLQQFKRRTDGSTVGVRRIPRVKLEYQLTRSIFLRAVGELDWDRQDDLRDDSRTGLPIVIRDASGAYAPALGHDRRNFRTDWLFSYQPTPGTVIFAGYGNTLLDPDARAERGGLRRASDGFFLKLSYLFRM
jgi:hypothetical protein